MAVWFIRDIEEYEGGAYNLSKAQEMYIFDRRDYGYIDVKARFVGDDIITLIHSEGVSRTDIGKIFDGIVETVATQSFALIRLSEIKSKYLSDEN